LLFILNPKLLESYPVCNMILIYYISYWLGLLGFWTLSIIWHSEEQRVSNKAVVSKMCSLEYHTTDKVQKHSNPKCHRTLLEPLECISNVLHQMLHWERMAHKLDWMLPDRTCVCLRVSNRLMRAMLKHKNKWLSKNEPAKQPHVTKYQLSVQNELQMELTMFKMCYISANFQGLGSFRILSPAKK
jgi:hypothetical protein